MNFEGIADNPIAQQVEDETIGATSAGISITSRSVAVETGLIPGYQRVATGGGGGGGFDVPWALVGLVGLGAVLLFWPKGGGQ